MSRHAATRREVPSTESSRHSVERPRTVAILSEDLALARQLVQTLAHPVLSAPAQGSSATPSCNVDPDWTVNPTMTALRGRPLRVVVAEANDDQRSHLRWLLSQLAVEVSAVASGGEIVMLLAHDDHPIDLLITNVELPWMSGIHVALAGRHSGFAMPMILLAARPNAHLRDQVNSLGAALLVGLPFRNEDLLSTVREQLRSTPREMESAGRPGGIDLLNPSVGSRTCANHGRRC